MAIQGFDKEFYLNAKLAQLQSDSATAADWAGKDAAFLEARFSAVGLTAEQHYEQYGYQEDLAPNAFFNPAEYIRAKATAMFNDTDSNYLTIDAAAEAFVNLWGGNVYNHYLQYGEDEGINPSNSFDVSGYYEAKLAQLQAEGNTEITTVEQVKEAFEAAGLTALEHFLTYGQTEEGLSAPAVPADEQVNVDTSVPGQVFTLTTGTDNEAGTSGDDTFTAGEINGAVTLTVGDQIDGGAGNDTLNWVESGAIDAIPTGASVQNVETVNVTSGGEIDLDTTSNFSGLTALNTNNSGAAQTLTAAATTDVTATVGAQAANAVAINGGKDVTVNATGTTTGTTTVGATTAAAGTVNVNSTASTGTQGAIGVTGGTAVNVTTATSNAVNTTVTQAAVTVTGDANTSEVTVSQDEAATAAAQVVGKVNGAVTVTDVNAASNTDAGVIETVTLNSYGASTINSGALNTINLSGTGGTLGVTAGALTTPVVSSLALNVSDLAAGAITLDADYETLNIAGTEEASAIANVTGAGVTELNVSGDAAVSLTDYTLANVETITSTNTAGLSLGTTTLGNDVTFTGGAGDDSVILGANTNAIEMGAGDDTVTLTTANLGAGGSVNGGEGNDTLVANVNGSAYSADPAVTGFETLRVAGNAAQGSHNANGFTALEIGTTNGATTFTSVAAGTGLTVLAAPTGGTTVTLANATGEEDSFDLTFASEGAIDYSTGGVSIADVETINITNTDTQTGDDAVAQTNTMTLQATAAESVVVTGNAGLNLTNTGNTAITNFDASGIQGEAGDAAALAVTFVSANTTVGAEVTITGGSGNDTLTGSAEANDTINGGAGDDTLVYTGGADSFTGGAGDDIFDVDNEGTKAAHLTIQDANAGDQINFADVVANGSITLNAAAVDAAQVTLGAAATLDQYLNAAADQSGSVASTFEWFQFGGNTYAVISNDDGTTGASAGFTEGTDAVIKLAGMVDLSDSAIATDVLTIA
jgi:S-layer protein